MNENVSNARTGAVDTTNVEENGGPVESGVKYFTLEDIKVHNMSNDTWIVIHDKVYDITGFLEEVRNTRAHKWISKPLCWYTCNFFGLFLCLFALA